MSNISKETRFKSLSSSFNNRGFTDLREDPHADLLADMEETGNPELDAAKEAELSLATLNNKKIQKAIAENIRVTTDSEYWFAACFETREQKEVFLKALKLFEHGDKYIDGALLAEAVGIKLPKVEFPYRAEAKPDKRLNKLVFEP